MRDTLINSLRKMLPISNGQCSITNIDMVDARLASSKLECAIKYYDKLTLYKVKSNRSLINKRIGAAKLWASLTELQQLNIFYSFPSYKTDTNKLISEEATNAVKYIISNFSSPLGAATTNNNLSKRHPLVI